MRCFVAIELPERVRAELEGLQERLAAKVRGVRWTRPELIHLTLKFLGDVSDEDVPAAGVVVAGIAGQAAPFSLALAGAGCFPISGPARIVWVGVADPPAGLLACQEACERRFEPLGCPRDERGFHPHLTVGRVKDPRASSPLRAALKLEEGFRASVFETRELILVQSVLQRDGPRYSVIRRVALCS